MKSMKRSLLAASLLLLGLLGYSSIEYNKNGRNRRGLQVEDQNGTNDDQSSSQMEQQQQQGAQGKRRPVMHTFFELKTDKAGRPDRNGAKQHQALLDAWKELWYDAGWEPRVLTLEDAKRHPRYDYYSEALNGEPGVIENVYQGGYDHLCFMRWLAMASIPEGGFMADYDTFPLDIDPQKVGFTLPNDGKFTSYENHIPSLLSGTADEWDRMSIKVLGTAIRRMKSGGVGGRYSDMFALSELKGNYIIGLRLYNDRYQPRVVGYPYKSKRVIDCEYLKGGGVYAMHLAHHYTRVSIESGLLDVPDGKGKDDRDYFARIVTKRWKMQCHSETLGNEVDKNNNNNDQSLRGSSSTAS